MNKQQFLAAIGGQLRSLPPSDVQKSLDYYSEMIDDRTEDGMSEEDAIKAMGDPAEIAAQILMELPLSKLVKTRLKPSRTLRAWEIVLLALGSPIWLSLLAAAVVLLLSVYIVLWAVIITVYAVDLSFAVGAVGGIVGCLALPFSGHFTLALLYLGLALLCAGLAILLFFVCQQITRQALRLSKAIIVWVKARFIRKGDAA